MLRSYIEIHKPWFHVEYCDNTRTYSLLYGVNKTLIDTKGEDELLINGFSLEKAVDSWIIDYLTKEYQRDNKDSSN